MLYDMVSGGHTGEHWIDSVPITKLYKKFNTTIGTPDTPILGLSGLTSAMENRVVSAKYGLLILCAAGSLSIGSRIRGATNSVSRQKATMF